MWAAVTGLNCTRRFASSFVFCLLHPKHNIGIAVFSKRYGRQMVNIDPKSYLWTSPGRSDIISRGSNTPNPRQIQPWSKLQIFSLSDHLRRRFTGREYFPRRRTLHSKKFTWRYTNNTSTSCKACCRSALVACLLFFTEKDNNSIAVFSKR